MGVSVTEVLEALMPENEAGVEVGVVVTGDGVPLGVVERPCAPLSAVLIELVRIAGVTELSELEDVTCGPAAV